jgi:hypothetical protein
MLYLKTYHRKKERVIALKLYVFVLEIITTTFIAENY